MKHVEGTVEFAVIGAGVIGSSVAWHLGELGGEVSTYDSDLEGTLSSSELNAGGVRATWTQAHNILASKMSIDYFASVAEEVGYRACGYTWLCRPEQWDGMVRARELQIELGWEVELWDVAELRKRIPFIDKTDDLRGAVFGVRDGLVNPNRLKHHYRDQAKKTGRVQFVDRMKLVEAQFDSGTGGGTWKLGFHQFGQGGGAQVTTWVHARNVINCAGPWASQVATLLGYKCPSHAVRRQISVFDCRDVDLTPFGMIVDPSRVYFHPEATNGLAGFANTDEPPGYRFDYDGESFFNENIWPMLYERSSHFERLKHITGWAGLYEVSPDECAILGPAEGAAQVFEAHSFSGHGVMQSFTAGKILAEEIKLGAQKSLDLTFLRGDRFSKGRPMPETQVI